MSDTIVIKRPVSAPGTITQPYATPLSGFFAVPDEWLAADEPLPSILAAHLAGEQAALFEWLRDRSVPGNDSRAVAGHHHARPSNGETTDSVRVARAGTFFLGTIRERIVTATAWEAVPFEWINTGYPNLDHEEEGTGMATSCPEIYLSAQHSLLRYPIAVSVRAGETGMVALELLDADEQAASPRVRVEMPITWTDRRVVWLEMLIPTSWPDGFAHLRLSAKVEQAGYQLTVQAADGAITGDGESQRGWLA